MSSKVAPDIIYKRDNYICGGMGNPWKGYFTVTITNVGKGYSTQSAYTQVWPANIYDDKLMQKDDYVPKLAPGESYDIKFDFSHGCLNRSLDVKNVVLKLLWKIDNGDKVKESDEFNNESSYKPIYWPFPDNGIPCGSTQSWGITKK